MFLFQDFFKQRGQLRKEAFVRQIGKGSLYLGNFQPVCMKQLGFQPVFFPVPFIKDTAAIFVIAQDGMAAVSKMGTDLMGASCDKLYLKKGDGAIAADRFVTCLYGKGSFCLEFLYGYFITFFVFMQISFDIFFIF